MPTTNTATAANSPSAPAPAALDSDVPSTVAFSVLAMTSLLDIRRVITDRARDRRAGDTDACDHCTGDREPAPPRGPRRIGEPRDPAAQRGLPRCRSGERGEDAV